MVQAARWDLAGDGNWSVSTNWDTGSVPGAGEQVLITGYNGFGKLIPNVTVNADVAIPAAHPIDTLTVNGLSSSSAPHDSKATLVLLSDLSSTQTDVGTTSNGEMVQANNTSFTTDQLTLGSYNSGQYFSGTYRLSSGTLTVGQVVFVGNGNTGDFHQAGGTHLILGTKGFGDLQIAGSDDGSGSYSMTGGVLSVARSIGVGANGSFGQGGGVVFANTLTVAPRDHIGFDGSFDQGGGTLVVSSIQNRSTLSQIAGGDATIRTGVVNNSGTFTVRGTFSIAGTFHNSGTAILGGTQTWGTNGELVNDAGVTTFESNPSVGVPGPHVTVNGGRVVFAHDTHLQTLHIAADTKAGYAGTVDVALATLQIDQASAGDVADMIRGGCNGGNWDGAGIVSSSADASHGVGYRVYDSGNATLGLALYGDANLDGVVTFDDLLALARRYNGASTAWFEGDFNYDRKTDFADLLALARNYGHDDASTDDPTALTPAIALDWTLARSVVVPEPAAMPTAGLAVWLTRRRPRRR